MRGVFLVCGVLFISTTSVMANKADYCAAYARDFADARTRDKPLWQHKYDIAQAACLTEPKKPVAPKPVVMKRPVVKPAAPIPPEPVMVETPPYKPVKPGQMEKGSEAWNAYCANKYTSFDVKKGTYMSLTGIERQCLVTKN
jgi:BA14K-like protein